VRPNKFKIIAWRITDIVGQTIQYICMKQVLHRAVARTTVQARLSHFTIVELTSIGKGNLSHMTITIANAVKMDEFQWQNCICFIEWGSDCPRAIVSILIIVDRLKLSETLKQFEKTRGISIILRNLNILVRRWCDCRQFVSRRWPQCSQLRWRKLSNVFFYCVDSKQENYNQW